MPRLEKETMRTHKVSFPVHRSIKILIRCTGFDTLTFLMVPFPKRSPITKTYTTTSTRVSQNIIRYLSLSYFVEEGRVGW